jgi:hypothetical protein
LNPKSQGREVTPEDLEDKVIPRGYAVIFGANGEHVALSSGARRPCQIEIKTRDGDKTIRITVTKSGHEILELDKGSSGVQETTIEEDLMASLLYAKQLTWSPMPTLQELQAVN